MSLKFYKAVSAFFHPIHILAIILLLGIILSFSNSRDLIMWILIGFGIIYGIPGLYYFNLLFTKKIDIDVKNNLPKRECIMKISTLSIATVFVISLYISDAEIFQKLLLTALGVNLLYIIAIHILRFELSVHVGTLSVLIIFLVYYLSPYFLFSLSALYLTALSRYKLRMHSFSELAAGIIGSSIIYILILIA